MRGVRAGRRLHTLLALVAGLIGGSVSAAPAISVVIDDLGDTLTNGRAAVELPGAVACAFLPESPHTRRLATEAHIAGKPVLLHLPLQPEHGRAHPLAINSTLPTIPRTEHLLRLLASVPFADGVNNHQGSRATASREQMHWLMRELSLAGIGYFLDSATTSQSQAYALARAYGLPAVRRRVFLDNEPTEAAVEAEFDRLLRLARRDGTALAIGHPHTATLRVLQRRLPQLASQGIELLAPAQLIERINAEPVMYPASLRFSDSLSAPPATPQTTASLPAVASGAPSQP